MTYSNKYFQNAFDQINLFILGFLQLDHIEMSLFISVICWEYVDSNVLTNNIKIRITVSLSLSYTQRERVGKGVTNESINKDMEVISIHFPKLQYF